jgi:anti-sigma-K factor RskA
LASIVEPVEPPAALRGSLLDAFDRELASPSPASLPARRTQRPSRLISAAGFGYALAAGLLIIAVALGAWGASRGGGDGAEVLVRNNADQAGTLQVTYIPSQNVGVMDYDLRALQAGQTYQAWHVDAAGNPVSLGVLAGEQGSVSFEGDFGATGAIALTIEPAGGSRALTTTPFLVTALSES